MFEVAESHAGNADRAIHSVRVEGVVYVFRALQTKSPSGIRTATGDVAFVCERLQQIREDQRRP